MERRASGNVEEAPEKPEYSLCNQGHDLVLIRNDRGVLTWDCPTCIEAMRKAREEFDDDPFDEEDMKAVAFDIEKRVKQESIDIEPTWTNLWRLACSGHIPVQELEKACVLADVVRQAQKRGEVITLRPDGSYSVEEVRA